MTAVAAIDPKKVTPKAPNMMKALQASTVFSSELERGLRLGDVGKYRAITLTTAKADGSTEEVTVGYCALNPTAEPPNNAGGIIIKVTQPDDG